MGVELYLVKPDGEGRVVFPFWTPEGVAFDGVEHECIAGLKWAMGHPALDGLLGPAPIPPAALVAGAERGIQRLLAGVTRLHADFAALAVEAEGDAERASQLLFAFENGEPWLGGDDASRERAFALAIEGAAAHDLLGRILRAGRRGFFGCWSY